MTAPATPLVSVVIPTFRRPGMVLEAVHSALAQTVSYLEVIVVVDGLDRETVEALRSVHDPRLRMVLPDRTYGNAEARNIGIRAAAASWVALLDDDDLWFKDKLAAQLKTATRSGSPSPVVSCRLIARTERAEFVWPRRMPDPDLPICDYLFRRHVPMTGDGIVQTSTILAPTSLFLNYPFDPKYQRYVDLDWLLRVGTVPGVELLFAGDGQPLSVYRIDDRDRVTNGAGWREDIVWAREHRGLLTRKAYAAFLLTLPSIRAAREGSRGAFSALLREAAGNGEPRMAELAFHCGNFALTPACRAWLARFSAQVGPRLPRFGRDPVTWRPSQ